MADTHKQRNDTLPTGLCIRPCGLQTVQGQLSMTKPAWAVSLFSLGINVYASLNGYIKFHVPSPVALKQSKPLSYFLRVFSVSFRRSLWFIWQKKVYTTPGVARVQIYARPIIEDALSGSGYCMGQFQNNVTLEGWCVN